MLALYLESIVPGLSLLGRWVGVCLSFTSVCVSSLDPTGVCVCVFT